MSTRCQVIVKDDYSEVWFYRHCDGYPEGVRPTLDKFCEWLRNGRIRKDAEQSAGWLVILGRAERHDWELPSPQKTTQEGPFSPGYETAISGWQVGAYEPCSPRMHLDIAYLYVVDVKRAEWRSVDFDASENTWKDK